MFAACFVVTEKILGANHANLLIITVRSSNWRGRVGNDMKRCSQAWKISFATFHNYLWVKFRVLCKKFIPSRIIFASTLTRPGFKLTFPLWDPTVALIKWRDVNWHTLELMKAVALHSQRCWHELCSSDACPPLWAWWSPLCSQDSPCFIFFGFFEIIKLIGTRDKFVV